MKRKAKADRPLHIRLNAERGRFECRRCGGSKAVALPARPLDYVEALERFWRAHARCAPKRKARAG